MKTKSYSYQAFDSYLLNRIVIHLYSHPISILIPMHQMHPKSAKCMNEGHTASDYTIKGHWHHISEKVLKSDTKLRVCFNEIMTAPSLPCCKKIVLASKLAIEGFRVDSSEVRTRIYNTQTNG